MLRTIISVVIMIFSAWIGLVIDSAINENLVVFLLPMITGVACIIYAIEAKKTNN